MHKMSSFCFRSVCHFLLFVLISAFSWQKTHPNFISKEQLMASSSPVGCGSHVTPRGRITFVSAFPLLSTVPPTPSCNTTTQLWLLLKQKYIKNKPKNTKLQPILAISSQRKYTTARVKKIIWRQQFKSWLHSHIFKGIEKFKLQVLASVNYSPSALIWSKILGFLSVWDSASSLLILGCSPLQSTTVH